MQTTTIICPQFLSQLGGCCAFFSISAFLHLNSFISYFRLVSCRFFSTLAYTAPTLTLESLLLAQDLRNKCGSKVARTEYYSLGDSDARSDFTCKCQ